MLEGSVQMSGDHIRITAQLIDAIKGNLTHLVRVLKSNNWSLLRRDPPYFLGVNDAVENVEDMVRELLAGIPTQHEVSPGFRTA